MDSVTMLRGRTCQLLDNVIKSIDLIPLRLVERHKCFSGIDQIHRKIAIDLLIHNAITNFFFEKPQFGEKCEAVGVMQCSFI